MIAGADTLPLSPTAKHSVDDQQATPASASLLGSAFGVATIDQPVPFHCSARLCDIPLVRVAAPTAKQAVAVEHDTSASVLTPAPETFGLAATVNVVPVERSIRVCVVAACAE